MNLGKWAPDDYKVLNLGANLIGTVQPRGEPHVSWRLTSFRFKGRRLKSRHKISQTEWGAVWGDALHCGETVKITFLTFIHSGCREGQSCCSLWRWPGGVVHPWELLLGLCYHVTLAAGPCMVSSPGWVICTFHPSTDTQEALPGLPPGPAREFPLPLAPTTHPLPFYNLFFFFLFVRPHLVSCEISPTRDGARAPCSGISES